MHKLHVFLNFITIGDILRHNLYSVITFGDMLQINLKLLLVLVLHCSLLSQIVTPLHMTNFFWERISFTEATVF